MKSWLSDWLERQRYYRFVDNWHSHPWICHLLCKIGRHDYEHHGPILNDDGKVIGGKLKCIVCCQEKHSYYEGE
jgi:hypothetical protein